MASALHGCRVKLNRARQHRCELEAFTERSFPPVPIPVPPEWLNDPSRVLVSAHLDPSSGEHVFRVASIPPGVSEFQDAVAARIGDCLHNLRSCLDHLVYQLACRATADKPRGERSLQFPIVDNPEEFKKEAPRRLPGVEADHVAVIESYQPYHPRRGSWEGPYIHELAMLREMSNRDKHRLLEVIIVVVNGHSYWLPPGVSTVPLAEFTTAEEIDAHNPFRNAEYVLRLGAEICRHRLQHQTGDSIPAVIPHLGVATVIVCQEERRRATGVLERIEKLVSEIIEAFEKRLT